jgi:hypothetical protein
MSAPSKWASTPTLRSGATTRSAATPCARRPSSTACCTFDRERDRAWREELERERQEYLKGLRAESVFDEREREEPSERASAEPQPSAPTRFAGTWRGAITGGDPLPPEGVPFTLRIRQEGNQLRGTLETPLGAQEFSIAAPDGDTLTITLEVGGMSADRERDRRGRPTHGND